MAYNSKYTGAEVEDKLDNIPVDYVVADSTIQEDFEAGQLPSTTVNWEGVKNKPTTVEGYGITDAKIDRGTIFLGSASITPITEHQDISGKQDTIPDLSAIRSGAAAGSTALQPSAISDMETKTHASSTYVAKVSGKGLSTNDYTTTEKNKLAGIAAGAEVNVQADWNVTDTNSNAFIKNKPTIPTVNNGTLTIQKNGTQVATFSANQSGNQTANITVPTKVSELENDRNYLTEHQSGFNLLKTYTLEQSVSVALVTQDENGNGIMVKEAIVEIEYPYRISREIKCIPAQIFNGEPDNYLYDGLSVGVNSYSQYWVCKFTRLSKKTYLRGCSNNGNEIAEIYFNGYDKNIQSDTEYIQAICLTATTTIPVGTIIKVYGR